MNSIGDATCRPGYRQALIEYFAPHEDRLTDDSRRRLRVNPLRVLDDRELDPELAAGAPRALDHLCDACRAHFDGRPGAARRARACATRSTIGWCAASTTTREPRSSSTSPAVAGQQQALGGGGRYDGLAELLGGRPTPGIGFGIGIDRTVLAPRSRASQSRQAAPLVAVVGADPEALAPRLRVAGNAARGRAARAADGSDRKLGRQLESAAKAGARWAVIVGEELSGGGGAAGPGRRRAARCAWTVALERSPRRALG